MGGRRRCCCEGECVTVTDDFNRADAEDLGANWDITGTWEISSNKAKGTSGYAIHVQNFPDANGTMWVTARGVNAQYGDAYTYLLAWYDANNYLYAKFVAPVDEFADQIWETIFGEVVDGVATETSDLPDLNPECPGFNYIPFTEGGGIQQYVLYDGDALIRCGVDSQTSAETFVRCVGPRTKTPANRAGIAHGGGAIPIWFDYFEASEHYRTDSECPDCGCNCGYNCLADTLTVTMDVIYGTCDQQITFPAEFELYRFKHNQRVWRSDQVLFCDCLPSFSANSRLWFVCAEQQGANRTSPLFEFGWYQTTEGEGGDTPCPPSVGEIPDAGFTLVSVECDPLEIVFDSPDVEGWACCLTPDPCNPPLEPINPVYIRVWITENVS
jgi:hypothetical protein